MNRLIQWFLSIVFPYNKPLVEVSFTDSEWDTQKCKESEDFYGGQDGTWLY
jgi:hypothetical protein